MASHWGKVNPSYAPGPEDATGPPPAPAKSDPSLRQILAVVLRLEQQLAMLQETVDRLVAAPDDLSFRCQACSGIFETSKMHPGLGFCQRCGDSFHQAECCSCGECLPITKLHLFGWCEACYDDPLGMGNVGKPWKAGYNP